MRKQVENRNPQDAKCVRIHAAVRGLVANRPRSARHALLRGLRQAVLVTAGLALPFFFLTPGVQLAAPVESTPAVTAADLIAEHDCWTGEGPEGVIPGHVVVTIDGTPTLGGERMTGKMLEQLFDGADHGLPAPHAFCR